MFSLKTLFSFIGSKMGSRQQKLGTLHALYWIRLWVFRAILNDPHMYKELNVKYEWFNWMAYEFTAPLCTLYSKMYKYCILRNWWLCVCVISKTRVYQRITAQYMRALFESGNYSLLISPFARPPGSPHSPILRRPSIFLFRALHKCTVFCNESIQLHYI